MAFAVKVYSTSGDIRRFTVPDASFASLVHHCHKFFQLSEETNLSLAYTDNEGDKVLLNSDLELAEALRQYQSSTKPLPIYLEIITNDGKEQESTVQPTEDCSTACPVAGERLHALKLRCLGRLGKVIPVSGASATVTASPVAPAAEPSPAEPKQQQQRAQQQQSSEEAATAASAPAKQTEWQIRREELRQKVLKAKRDLTAATTAFKLAQEELRIFNREAQKARIERLQAAHKAAKERLAKILAKKVGVKKVAPPPPPPATANPATPAAAETPATNPTRDFDSRFVSFTSCPTDTVVQAGQPFTVGFRVRNNGCSTWPIGTLLLRLSRFETQLVVPETVTLERVVAPGEEIDIPVSCVAPNANGAYEVFFKLALPDGRKFGQRLRARVMVENATETPTTTSAPSTTETANSAVPAEPANATPTTTQPPSQPAESSDEEKYAAQLKQLAEMGFTNEKQNLRLLKKFNDFNIVVTRLARYYAALAAKATAKIAAKKTAQQKKPTGK